MNKNIVVRLLISQDNTTNCDVNERDHVQLMSSSERKECSMALVFSNSFNCIKNASFLKSIDHDVGPGLDWFPRRNEPVDAFSLDDRSSYVHFHLMYWDRWLQLWLHLLGIPWVKALLNVVLDGFVHRNIHGLQLIGTICWDQHRDDTMLFKQWVKLWCSLASKAIEKGKSRWVFSRLIFALFSFRKGTITFST